MQKRRRVAIENLGALEKKGILVAERFLPVLQRAPATLSPREVLNHGDLYPRHLIVDDKGDLVGVIDWGDAHFGHRAKDLAVGFLYLPKGARADFRDAYSEGASVAIDDDEWAGARLLALFHATVQISYGLDTGDRAMVDIGKRALEYCRDELGS